MFQARSRNIFTNNAANHGGTWFYRNTILTWPVIFTRKYVSSLVFLAAEKKKKNAMYTYTRPQGGQKVWSVKNQSLLRDLLGQFQFRIDKLGEPKKSRKYNDWFVKSPENFWPQPSIYVYNIDVVTNRINNILYIYLWDYRFELYVCSRAFTLLVVGRHASLITFNVVRKS